jgi:predicted CopG family antitoxin
MSKKLTITVDDEVYDGLHSRIGRGRISRFINDLAKPHVLQAELDAGYETMAADSEHEREALEWIEGVVEDVADA